MSKFSNREELLAAIRRSGLIPDQQWGDLQEHSLPDDPAEVLSTLEQQGLLTRFHVRALRKGKTKGFLLAGYRVLRPLGKGGMGIVYLAEHTTLNRRVALKVLRDSLPESDAAKERFLREGRAAASLDHPNIVRVYEFGEEDGVWYLVMEYLAGKSLEAVIAEKGHLPVDVAVNYATQVARGLRHAHENGVVHRDIKPANLIVDEQDVVKILDMGLAKFFHDTRDNLTERVGSMIGSPDYMAPEQARNELDTRSDIYSLGGTLYTLLLGQPPFNAPTVQQKLLHHQMRPPIAPHVRNPRVPVELSLVVLRMLAKSPGDRFQNPGEVIAALEPFDAPIERRVLPSAAVSLTASPVSPLPRKEAEPPGRNRKGLVAAVFIGFLLLGWLVSRMLASSLPALGLGPEGARPQAQEEKP